MLVALFCRYIYYVLVLHFSIHLVEWLLTCYLAGMGKKYIYIRKKLVGLYHGGFAVKILEDFV